MRLRNAKFSQEEEIYPAVSREKKIDQREMKNDTFRWPSGMQQILASDVE